MWYGAYILQIYGLGKPSRCLHLPCLRFLMLHDSDQQELVAELESQKHSITTRFQEIAVLTNFLESKEKEHQNELGAFVREWNGQLVQVRSRLASLNKDKSAKLFHHKEFRNHVQIIKDSGLFDIQWYLTQYPDIASNTESAKNPILHYVQLGGYEGRNPSEKFNTIWYLEQNEDVALEGFNPLIHYILHGKSEGRLPRPPYDQT